MHIHTLYFFLLTIEKQIRLLYVRAQTAAQKGNLRLIDRDYKLKLKMNYGEKKYSGRERKTQI